jgi:hypothetical protein
MTPSRTVLSAKCRYADCHYAECRYAECRSALLVAYKALLSAMKTIENYAGTNAACCIALMLLAA